MQDLLKISMWWSLYGFLYNVRNPLVLQHAKINVFGVFECITTIQ